MTQKEAKIFMNEQFDKFAQKAREADNVDDEIKFTAEAHKLFITLTQTNAFEKEAGAEVKSSDIPQ